MLHSVSRPLPPDIRFLWLLDPDLQQLALRLACPEGRRTWGATFRASDPVSDVGAPWTPVALQLRVSTLSTHNLATRRLHWEAALDQ